MSVLLQFVCLFLIKWILLKALNEVTSIELQTKDGTVSGSTADVDVTLWYNFTIYQYTLKDTTSNTTYTYHKNETPKFQILGTSNCHQPSYNNIPKAKIMVTCDDTDAITISWFKFYVESGDWFGITSFYRDTDKVRNFCVDNQATNCAPYKQMLYFDTTRANVEIDDAAWSDATNIAPDIITCEPISEPTKNPTDSPTNEPSKTPTNPPTKSQVADPTPDPFIVPTSSPNRALTIQPFAVPTVDPTIIMMETMNTKSTVFINDDEDVNERKNVNVDVLFVQVAVAVILAVILVNISICLIRCMCNLRKKKKESKTLAKEDAIANNISVELQSDPKSQTQFDDCSTSSVSTVLITHNAVIIEKQLDTKGEDPYEDMYVPAGEKETKTKTDTGTEEGLNETITKTAGK